MTTYAAAIYEGFHYLLANHADVFVIGQGLWSPWYVGATMTNLELEFGRERVIDTPVSEQATTGVGVGASLCGYRPVVTHPRVDFALLAVDQMVNQAAKWSSMFGGGVKVPVTFRCIVNRGGEQGAQHSQSLYSWFAHIPGLRVVAPATPADARDLLIASVLSDDPVIFMDDRWLYDLEADLPAIEERDLNGEGSRVVREGSDITVVAASYSSRLSLDAAAMALADGISCDVVDLRVLNVLDVGPVIESVRKTGRLCAVDGDWRTCGIAGEIIAAVAEAIELSAWHSPPSRVTLPSAPAPTSRALEQQYYPTVEQVVAAIRRNVNG